MLVLATVLMMLISVAATISMAASSGNGVPNVDKVPILVKFKASAGKADIDNAIHSSGGESGRDLSQIRTHVIYVPANARDRILEAYKNNPSVERANGAIKLQVAGIPDDPKYAQQWALPKIAWDTAYDTISISSPATLAVLDTGVDATHPDLSARMTTGNSSIGGDPNADPNGHGTALAGIAAASVNNSAGIAGVSYASTNIMPVQVLQADGTGYDSDVIAGVIWAADNGANVILMGFSSPDYSAALADAIAYASGNGVVLVAATGNDGSTAPSYPAGMANVIGVAATDENDNLASGSNTGSALIAAPGTNIYTTLPGGSYGSVGGTSAASAHAGAGLAALLAANGNTNDSIYNQIIGAADPIGQSFGRINVTKALGGAVGAVPTPVVTATPTPVPSPTYVVGATTTNGDGTMVVNMTNVTVGSTGNNFNFNFTVTGSNPYFAAGSQARIIVPAGWTAPQNSSPSSAGFVSVAAGITPCSAFSFNNITTGSGPWNITIDMTCGKTENKNEQFNLTYAYVTAPTTTGIKTFITQTKIVGGTLTNITSGSPTVTVSPGAVSLKNTSALTKSVIAGTNATYTLNLTNNGTLTDTYTLSLSNPNSASAVLNISSTITLTPGTTQIFALNVSSITAGTFPVNVTAISSDPTKFAYVNTTTTVTVPAVAGAPSITGSAPASPVSDVYGATRRFNITANQTVNVTWYINGTVVQTNISVPANTLINYTNFSAAVGFWNVTAIANNTNGTASQKWNWTVNRADTTVVLASSVNASVFGQTVNFTATVSAVAPGAGTPGGTVQFKIDGSNFGSLKALSGGIAKSDENTSLSVGNHVVTAVYSGDTNFSTSTSSALSQVVNKRSTSTVVSLSPGTVGEGRTSTVNVIVTDTDVGTKSSPSGTVTLSSSVGTDIISGTCSLTPNGADNANCSVTIQPQDDSVHTITATYQASNTHSTSTNNTGLQVNNLPPVITSVTGPVNPLPLSAAAATITVNFTDPGILDTHNCTFSWDDNNSNTTSASGIGNGSCSATHNYLNAGVYTVGVNVTDDDYGYNTSKFEYVVVYDPNGGFVTGGGWINSTAGAYTANPLLTGKANFGFVSKYQKSATVPTGETEFQFQVASFNFHSTVYEWLVVSGGGAKAQYKGSGTVNGVSGYGFLLTATDGNPDKFRIKIVNKATGAVVYDNVLGAPDDIDTASPQALGGGSIVIHK